MANRKLNERIKAVYHESHKTYGSPRVYVELKAQGVACSVNRVARLMRLRNLQAIGSRRYKCSEPLNLDTPVTKTEVVRCPV
jgi:putative transposase